MHLPEKHEFGHCVELAGSLFFCHAIEVDGDSSFAASGQAIMGRFGA
jgi:hypothetical protein